MTDAEFIRTVAAILDGEYIAALAELDQDAEARLRRIADRLEALELVKLAHDSLYAVQREVKDPNDHQSEIERLKAELREAIRGLDDERCIFCDAVIVVDEPEHAADCIWLQVKG